MTYSNVRAQLISHHRSKQPWLVLLLLTGLVVDGLSGQARLPVPRHAAALALENVTVVDVHSGALLKGQTVVVSGTRIQAVGPVNTVRLPANVQRIDATNKYLIPGLWDMHVHTMMNPDIFYPYALAKGVTGVQEMSSPVLASLLQWRREIAGGQRVGPRIIATGGFIGTPADAESVHRTFPKFGLDGSDYVGVRTVDEARQAVRTLQRAGADFIKIHSAWFRRDVYFAIAAEARRLGVPLAGHLPDSVTPAEASDSGQRSFEHLGSEACGYRRPDVGLDTMPADHCVDLGVRFARNRTWVMPGAGGVWTPKLCRAQDTVGTRCVAHPADPAEAWTVLPVLAGTDMTLLYWSGDLKQLRTESNLLNPEVYPIQDLLSILVAAGMTPLGALQTATLNPAKYLNGTDSLGSIAPGKLADLVLLDGNPLTDIWNTTRIRAVLANGRYYDRAALDGLFAAADHAAELAAPKQAALQAAAQAAKARHYDSVRAAPRRSSRRSR